MDVTPSFFLLKNQGIINNVEEIGTDYVNVP